MAGLAELFIAGQQMDLGCRAVSVGRRLLGRIKRWRHEEEKRLADAHRAAGEIQEIIGRGRYGFDAPLTVSLGRPNPRKELHPEHLAGSCPLIEALSLLDETPIVLEDNELQEIDTNGDMILMGGANSTDLSMLAFEYEEVAPRSYIRRPDAFIPLRYYGIADCNYLGLQGPAAWNMEETGPVSVVSRPFFDIVRQRRLWLDRTREAEVEVEGRLFPRLLSNNLLITKLPNFLDPHFKNYAPVDLDGVVPSIVIFAGNNGVGTRALELLLETSGRSLLTHLATSLRGLNAWQVMLRVSSPETTSYGCGYDRFTDIQLQDPVADAIVPIDVGWNTYCAAHDRGVAYLQRLRAQRCNGRFD